MLAVDAELTTGGLGGPLMIESLANILAVRLLRYIFGLRRRVTRSDGVLTRRKLTTIVDYIMANLHRSPTLEHHTDVGCSQPPPCGRVRRAGLSECWCRSTGTHVGLGTCSSSCERRLSRFCRYREASHRFAGGNPVREVTGRQGRNSADHARRPTSGSCSCLYLCHRESVSNWPDARRGWWRLTNLTYPSTAN